MLTEYRQLTNVSICAETLLISQPSDAVIGTGVFQLRYVLF